MEVWLLLKPRDFKMMMISPTVRLEVDCTRERTGTFKVSQTCQAGTFICWPEVFNFITKETLAQVFSCEFYEISGRLLLSLILLLLKWTTSTKRTSQEDIFHISSTVKFTILPGRLIVSTFLSNGLSVNRYISLDQAFYFNGITPFFSTSSRNLVVIALNYTISLPYFLSQ